MRPRSLRARLALWHAGLLAVTLAALALLILFLLKHFLNSRADAALYDYADKTARIIAASEFQTSLGGNRERARFLNKELQEWGRQIQVVDASTGKPIEWSDGLASQKLPISLTARVRGQQGLPTYETRTDLGERPVRIVTVPVQMGEQVPYLVQTAASLEGIEDALSRASLVLLVLTPSVLVLSLLGGWLLVGRSLRTVDAVTRAALAIKPDSFHHTIAAPGTDDEIARLADAFNEMLTRLEASFRQIQRFSADASHELKTPLTSIRGEAEVALMGERTPEEYRKTLSSIVDEVERMTAIVENLLLLARADARQIEIKQRRVALHEEVMQAFEQMEAPARKKHILLDIGAMEEAEIYGDPLWIGLVLTNLLNNAIKYTPEGGKVTLSLTTTAPQEEEGRPEAIFSVTDTGPGIPPEHQALIFDRFYRVDSGRSRDAGGVGLGLNIARWAVEAHQGRIEVRSEVGQGATFLVYLPLAAAEHPPEEARPRPEEAKR
jgi:heavy metal sensor kinase